MNRFGKFILIIVSLAYPLVVLIGIIYFQASARVLSLALLVVAVLNILANRQNSRSTRREIIQFWIFASLLGLVIVFAWITDNPDFVKVYPVLLTSFFLVTFLFSLISGPSVIFKIASLRDKALLTSKDRPAIERYCRTVTTIWCVFFVLNISISLWTVVAADSAVWAIYNGIVSYVLMGILLSVEFVYRKLVFKQ